MKQQYRKKKGFSLIELMVVVAILGILATAVVIGTTGQSIKAMKVRVKSDFQVISQALKLYHLDMHQYPETLQELMVAPGEGAENWTGPYLDTPPVDPWGRDYVYTRESAVGAPYDLISYAADGAEGGNTEETEDLDIQTLLYKRDEGSTPGVNP